MALRPWLLPVLLMLALSMAAPAQDLARQPTAFTAWLDFHDQTRELPIWIEGVEKQTAQPDSNQPETTTYRIRFRHFAGLVDDVLLRVYFQDQAGAQPTLSAWSEIGIRALAPRTLGQGLGLPSSETVSIPMATVDYVDIQVPGDGALVRGALAMAVRKSESQAAMDFSPAAAVTDPFGNSEPAVTGSDDQLLFGRVKATLEPGVIPLGAPGGAGNIAGFDFPLDRAPLIALLTFEVLNADVASPPQLSVNGKELGDVTLNVPDLADPALSGAIEPARPDVVYHYAGWLKCQKIIPGSLLTAGTNELLITSPAGREPVALRAIEVQLKYTPDATAP